jgi:hypothetical protein
MVVWGCNVKHPWSLRSLNQSSCNSAVFDYNLGEKTVMGKHNNHSRQEDVADAPKMAAVSQVLHIPSDYEK